MRAEGVEGSGFSGLPSRTLRKAYRFVLQQQSNLRTLRLDGRRARDQGMQASGRARDQGMQASDLGLRA